MTTTRGIAPSPSRLPKAERANWPTAPAVVPAPPFGGLGSAARFEQVKEKAMESQTMTTDEMYADPMVVPGMTLVRTIGDKIYPYRFHAGAWYVQFDPAKLNDWLRFETPAAREKWFKDRMAEELARIDAVFASLAQRRNLEVRSTSSGLDEAARRIEARCDREENSPARIRQET